MYNCTRCLDHIPGRRAERHRGLEYHRAESMEFRHLSRCNCSKYSMLGMIEVTYNQSLTALAGNCSITRGDYAWAAAVVAMRVGRKGMRPVWAMRSLR